MKALQPNVEDKFVSSSVVFHYNMAPPKAAEKKEKKSKAPEVVSREYTMYVL